MHDKSHDIVGADGYDQPLMQPSPNAMPDQDELTIINATRDMLAGLEQAVLEGSGLKPEEYTNNANATDDNPSALGDLLSAIHGMRQLMVASYTGGQHGGRPSSKEYIGDIDSHYNQALGIVLLFLDRCCDRWGFPAERTYSAADIAKDAQSKVLGALLDHLENYFGLTANVQIGGEIPAGSIIEGTLPVTNQTQRQNTVAEIVRIGFAHNDGTLMRPAHVCSYVPALVHAAKLISSQAGILR